MSEQKPLEFLQKLVDEIADVEVAGPGPVFDKWQLRVTDLLGKIDQRGAERFAQINFQSRQIRTRNDPRGNERHEREALSEGLQKARPILEHVIESKQQEEPAVDPTDPNVLARRVVKIAFEAYEQQGDRETLLGATTKEFLATGLTPDEIRRGLARLRDHGPVSATTFPGWDALTVAGMKAVENGTLDEALPLRGSRRPSHAAPSSTDHVADLAPSLSFMRPGRRAEVAADDLAELEQVLRVTAPKVVMLLCGSILEGALIDVLERRSDIAKSYFPKTIFPNATSLTQLLEIAANENLISGSDKNIGTTITDHRDLIHPDRQIRDNVTIEPARASAMVNLLRLVIGALKKSDEDGAIAAYVTKT